MIVSAKIIILIAKCLRKNDNSESDMNDENDCAKNTILKLKCIIKMIVCAKI